MRELLCAFCWMRGEVLDGRRLRTPAVLVINGQSVCDLEKHQEAALLGDLASGVKFLARQAGPQVGQDHTAQGMGNRVPGPNEVSDDPDEG